MVSYLYYLKLYLNAYNNCEFFFAQPGVYTCRVQFVARNPQAFLRPVSVRSKSLYPLTAEKFNTVSGQEIYMTLFTMGAVRSYILYPA